MSKTTNVLSYIPVFRRKGSQNAGAPGLVASFDVESPNGMKVGEYHHWIVEEPSDLGPNAKLIVREIRCRWHEPLACSTQMDHCCAQAWFEGMFAGHKAIARDLEKMRLQLAQSGLYEGRTATAEVPAGVRYLCSNGLAYGEEASEVMEELIDMPQPGDMQGQRKWHKYTEGGIWTPFSTQREAEDRIEQLGLFHARAVTLRGKRKPQWFILVLR